MTSLLLLNNYDSISIFYHAFSLEIYFLLVSINDFNESDFKMEVKKATFHIESVALNYNTIGKIDFKTHIQSLHLNK